MDVIVDPNMTIYVNNEPADDTTEVYENFSIRMVLEDGRKESGSHDDSADSEDYEPDVQDDYEASDEDGTKDEESAQGERGAAGEKKSGENDSAGGTFGESTSEEDKSEGDVSEEVSANKEVINIGVIANKKPVTLMGKSSYMFVDIFDYIDFDLNTVQGSMVVTNLNGKKAEYMEPLHEGDIIEVYWEK